jgi:leucyl-tRNA synthetase
VQEKYDHKEIEKKWQEKWQEENLYKTSENLRGPKSYVLDMFPYPSGDGLHIGHPKGYIATDVYSRMKKMQGFNILHPMGFDAFGLPAENYAIKNKIHPRIAVEKNIKRFKEQLGQIGFNYDWERQVNTTDPEYYKWTQWAFLKMLEKGLAYESYEPINWCPSCQTGLANEDLENGVCERCGSVVEKKSMRQWVLKITDYAERLLSDLESLNWPEYIKESQRNWIGKSEGTQIGFELRIKNHELSEEKIEVFTTRIDTLFGVTYLVVAPEYEKIEEWKKEGMIKNWSKVEKYIKETKNKNEIERTDVKKEKTGVEIKGIKVINPANGEEVPVFVADYVLGNYGTGAVMAVPAHDSRDFAFAKKYNLPVVEVISGGNISKEAHVGEGVLVNSEKFDGIKSEEAREKITEKFGKKVVKYKLRDWVFSRQRYWGEPIPVVHCEKCGVVAVLEKDLPIKLPEVEHYEPAGTGESPLANISEWVNTTCPKCGGPAKRETNTMPQWAGSSWYYLRYIDPKNDKELVNKEKEKYWSPVDMYVGGAEHATRHLIYARFWHKFLFDLKVVNYKEPFTRFQNVGLILAQDGKKMSKRFGNVINPDDIVETWGADTLRIYEMFMGPFADSIAWNTDNLIGGRRFLEKVWRISSEKNSSSTNFSASRSKLSKLEVSLHKTIKKVTEDIENYKFNTAISAMMILVNEMESASAKGYSVTRENFEMFLKILSPFAPHICEEIWHNLDNKTLITTESWPKYDEAKIAEEKVIIVVSINGKARAQFEANLDIGESEVKDIAMSLPEAQKWLTGQNIKKMIFVPNKIINFVV